MALKKVDTSSFTKLDAEQYKFETPGDTVHGILQERVTLTSKPDKKGQTKEFQKYVVQSTNGGNLVSFLGTHQIDKGLAEAKTGMEVRIQFQGMKRLPNGNNLGQYDVEVDTDSAPSLQTKTAAEVVAESRI